MNIESYSYLFLKESLMPQCLLQHIQFHEAQHRLCSITCLLLTSDYNGIHTHGNGEETLRLTNVSGDVVIGCGLNSTECTVTADIKVLPNGKISVSL